MGFLKRFLGAFSGGGGSTDDGIYVYVKLDRSGEIVQLRINKGNEISRDDEGQLFVRKFIIGSRSLERAEATLYFDARYRIINADIAGGELAEEAAYRLQEEAREEAT